MSMTTEAGTRSAATLRATWRRWGGTLVIAITALAGWLTILMAVTVIAEPNRDVLVLGPPQHTLSLLRGTDIRVSDLKETHAVLHGSTRGFVRTLYAHGAVMVLPARIHGCMPFGR